MQIHFFWVSTRLAEQSVMDHDLHHFYKLHCYLLSDLLEAVDDRDASDGVDSRKGLQADGGEVVLTCNLAEVNDCLGWRVNTQHAVTRCLIDLRIMECDSCNGKHLKIILRYPHFLLLVWPIWLPAFSLFSKEPELGTESDPSMVLTPFPSIILDETRFEPTTYRSWVKFANH